MIDESNPDLECLRGRDAEMTVRMETRQTLWAMTMAAVLAAYAELVDARRAR